MSKPKKSIGGRKDDGYPFETGNWEKWSNRRRLDWMINLRDKLRDKYKDKFNISDEQIARISTDIEAMESVVFGEEYNAAQAEAQSAATPRESAKMLGEIIGDVCANDYYKARRIGLTDEQLDNMRSDLDRYIGDIEAWEKRENARNILGFAPPPKTAAKDIDDDTPDHVKLRAVLAFSDIDDTALKAAFESGDEEAVNREWDIWIGQLQAKVEKDPIFAKWFEDFRAEQELLLRWDDTIGYEEDQEE